MTIEFRYALGQIQGGRPQQQDVVRAAEYDNALLLCLADGMGGAAGGLEAAQQAITAAIAYFDESRAAPDALLGAVKAANNSVAELKATRPALAGAGTTLVVALVESRSVTWISVGDSPLFVCGKGQIRRLNADHSVGAALRTLEKASERKRSNILRSTISGTPVPLIDIATTPTSLKPGERIVLASDGLLELDEKVIGACCKANSPDSAVESLLQMAASSNREDLDNTSVIVADAPVAPSRGWGWIGKR